jgi:hypothetical protein
LTIGPSKEKRQIHIPATAKKVKPKKSPKNNNTSSQKTRSAHHSAHPRNKHAKNRDNQRLISTLNITKQENIQSNPNQTYRQ